MDPEEKELLRKSFALSQENNEILRSMRRNARVSSLFRAIYWIAIIVVTYMAYQYLQPYLQKLEATYQGVQSAENSLPSVSGFFSKFESTSSSAKK
jgi:hypothetical protein